MRTYYEAKLIDLPHAMLMPSKHDFRPITKISYKLYFQVKSFICYLSSLESLILYDSVFIWYSKAIVSNAVLV